jgi:uroporphyrinogen III methyltransferase/synthase
MTVYLVGAGPGDPDLITVRGLSLIKKAEVILYDRLASPKLLAHAPAACICEYVGKSPGDHAKSQEEINAALVSYGKTHAVVVRLKGGDPFVFGRGGEEALALVEAGISFEVVPGISSSVAGPAYAGIPVTHRGHNTAVTILTGHRWDASRIKDTYAGLSGTLVILMGAASFPEISKDLIGMGYAPDTPAAAIHDATLPSQSTLLGTLESLAMEPIPSPSVIVVGSVASLHESLSWHTKRISALKGRRVLLMRGQEQYDESVQYLAAFGAHVVSGGHLSVMPLAWDASQKDSADLIIVTSANTVPVLKSQNALFPHKRYIAIGPKSKAALLREGIEADMPEQYTSEGLGSYIISHYPPSTRILALRSLQASRTLQTLLADYEYVEMPVYDIDFENLDSRAVASCDIVFFTSTAMVKAIADLVPEDAIWISIGPVTSHAMHKMGIPPHVQAAESTIESMVEAVLDYLH